MDFSPTDHLDAVHRTVRTVTREGAELRRITVTRTYPAAVADVWDALTTPERIERWLAPVTGDLEPGGRFQVEGNAGGRVLRCDEPEHLGLTWEFGDQVSWVDVSLRPVDGGTLVQLDHDVPVDDHWAQFGPGATGMGWELMLMGMALHLDAPDAPRPSPDELPDLSGYLRSSSGAWAQARVADGDDAGEAGLAAARCLAAYLGEPTEG